MDSRYSVSGVKMAVFCYCIAGAYERDRLYEPCKQLWWSRQCKGRGTSMYFSKCLSAVYVNISFKHTSTRELSELVR